MTLISVLQTPYNSDYGPGNTSITWDVPKADSQATSPLPSRTELYNQNLSFHQIPGYFTHTLKFGEHSSSGHDP